MNIRRIYNNIEFTELEDYSIIPSKISVAITG